MRAFIAKLIGSDGMNNTNSLKFIKDEYEHHKPTSILDTIQMDEMEKKFVQEDKYSLIIAVLSDQSVKSEIAWRLPLRLKERVGEENLKPHWITTHQELVYQAIKTKPALHRFPQKIANFIISMSQLLIDSYEGTADNLLLSSNDYNEFVSNLKEIKGISEKKANLMFLILILDFNIEFSNIQNSQALLDVHIKRYLGQILKKAITQEIANEFFKKIDAENPARVSPFIWDKIRNESKV